MQMDEQLRGRLHRSLGMVAAASCLVSIADGAIPQLQMHLLGGHMLTNALAKVLLIACIVLGAWVRPKISLGKFPVSTWQLCVAFLLFEAAYLSATGAVSLIELLQSFNGYYSMVLLAPAALVFRGVVPERFLVRWTVLLFLVCAVIGIAQYLTAKPLLYTESVDEQFVVQSWEFYGDVRAFSLFSSGLNFGTFCALCGALGVALARSFPQRGLLLALLSAFACYTTLTRNCYIVFFFACAYSALMTMGKGRSRGLWSPLVFVILAVATIFGGMNSYEADPATGVQNASSLVERIIEWLYYSDLFIHASTAQQAFGLGMTQNDKIELPIDNMPLAIALQIGIVGVLILSALHIRMWLYLRQQVLAHQQPFVVAAASLWATLFAAGVFNIVPFSFGSVFVLSVFCAVDEKKQVVPCPSA